MHGTSTLSLSQAILLLLLKTASGVVVTIKDVANKHDPPVGHRRFHLKDISWHGSHIQGVALHRTNYDDHWTITAPLVYALPNSGCPRGLMNEQDVGGSIVLFDRGEDAKMTEQMYSAQHVGAIGVVIVDYPDAIGKQTALQVALRADHELWKRLTIPAVIVDFERGERLKSGMSLINGDIPIYGNQYVMEGSDFAALFVRREVGDEL